MVLLFLNFCFANHKFLTEVTSPRLSRRAEVAATGVDVMKEVVAVDIVEERKGGGGYGGGYQCLVWINDITKVTFYN